MQLHTEKYAGYMQKGELQTKSSWSIVKKFYKNSKHPDYCHSKIHSLGEKQWEFKRMQA